MRAALISPEAGVSLDGMFHERARRSPTDIAYRYYNDAQREWQDINWSAMLDEIGRWQAALEHEGLQPGDRVAIMLKNCPQWVMLDQAALGLGLVTVPLYTSDRPENVAHILADSGSKLLLIDSAERWHPVHEACGECATLQRIITLKSPPESDYDPRLRSTAEWLPDRGNGFRHRVSDPDTLATIIYTSGTTGRPKGVMQSHRNIQLDMWNAVQAFDLRADDILLSFLPLSHSLERSIGYYLAVMAGLTVAYARSIQQLQEDLSIIRPTILISVPRVFERILAGVRKKLRKGHGYAARLFDFTVDTGFHRFEHAQGRARWRWSLLLWPLLDRLMARKILSRLGGRLRLVLCGGAAVPPEVSRTFIGLGLNFLQGYGLTETSPVISVNLVGNNRHDSVGLLLPGMEARLDKDSVLHVRGPNVMQGYWANPAATEAILDAEGWLNTGDIAHIDTSGHIHITGRMKDILVLSNGEKIPPNDIETAILTDPLFEQVMVVGEGKPYLALLAVVDKANWTEIAQERDLPGAWPASLLTPQAQAFALARIAQQMKRFPGYARIRRVALIAEPWGMDNDLLTPTLKLKRNAVLERYRNELQKLYEGHQQE